MGTWEKLFRSLVIAAMLLGNVQTTPVSANAGVSVKTGASLAPVGLEDEDPPAEPTTEPIPTETAVPTATAVADTTGPELSSSVAPEGWTNTDVLVTISASDSGSGLDGIYDAGNAPLGGSPYTFTATNNGTWDFNARDIAGNNTGPLTVTVLGIDKVPPAPPTISVDTTAWSNQPVKFTLSYTADDGGSPVSAQYSLNGGEWLGYGGEVTVSENGSTNILARTRDAAGNSTEASSGATVKVDTAGPLIDLDFTANPAGGATISAAISDATTSIVQQKYASGSQDAAFFSGGGTTLESGSVEVGIGGVYSFYAIDEAGNETVDSINVNTYPTVGAISAQVLDEDDSLEVTSSAADLETEAGSLTVTASSSAPAMLPHPSVTNEDGVITITLAPAADKNGSATVTVSVSDAGGLIATTPFGVTINAVNDEPTAVDDSASTTEDTPVGIGVLDNDSDPDSDALTILSVSAASHGTVTITDPAHTITYTPGLDYTGDDSFSYTLEDAAHVQKTATVSVTVGALNDPPVLSSIANQTINEDAGTGPLPFTLSDVDNIQADLTYSAASSNQAVIPDANITITPGEGSSYSISAAPLTNTHTWNSTSGSHDPVTITITAGDPESTVQTSFTVTVNPVNDNPLPVADSGSTNEDSPVTINVINNDADTESEALTVLSVTQPAAGTGSAAVSGGTSVTYTPPANFNGVATFTYTVRDASGGTNSAAVTVTVNSINDLPAGVNNSVTLNEDIVTTIDVLANDTDVDLITNPGVESLTLLTVSDPGHGTVAIADNKAVYTPDSNWSGTDSFSYTFQDAAGAPSSATVNLTVLPVNDVPQFTNLALDYTVNEDNVLTIHFDITDVETPVESLQLQVTSGDETKLPANKVELSGLGDTDPDTTLKMTPAANKNGDVTMTLRLGDGFVVNTVTFTLHITPINDDPLAVNDSYTFTEDNSIVIDMDNLVLNDTDIDADTLSFVEIVADSLGSGSLVVLSEAAHTYTFTPPANFAGSTTFQYTVTDGTANDAGTVTLTAVPVNDPPTLILAPGNPTDTNEDTSVILNFTIHDWETAVGSLLVQAGSSNSDIVASDRMTVSCTDAGSNTRDCTLTVNPNDNKNTPSGGHITLTISVSDGVYLVPQTVELEIIPVQDPPFAVNDEYTLEESAILTLTPLVNDYEVDGQTLTISSLDTTGTHGAVVNNGDGTLRYTAASQYTGTDTFLYSITDGIDTRQATVTLTISGENHAPVIYTVNNQFTNEDTPLSGLTIHVSDPDTGSTLDVTAASSDEDLIANAGLTVNVINATTFELSAAPVANAFGTTTITLTVSDGTLTAPTTFTITVYPVNDAPVVVNDTVSLNEDIAAVFNPLSNDHDEESPLTIVSRTSPTRGQLSVAGGNFTYTPNANISGADSFSYTVTDGDTTATGTVTFTITPVNDTPVAYDDWQELPTNLVGENALIHVLGNDSMNGDTGETLVIDSIVSGPSSGTAVIESGRIRYTRTGTPVNGIDSFIYRISDGQDPALYDTATVHIAVDFGSSFYINDQWLTFTEDGPEQTITFNNLVDVVIGSASLGNSSVTGDNATSYVFHYTPNLNAYGSENLQISANSKVNPADSDTATIHITIIPVNDLPTISPVGDQEIDEDAATEILPVTIADADNLVDDLIFEAFSGNEDLVLPEGIAVTRSHGDITLVVTPIPNRFGTATITLLASDGIAQTTEIFLLTVNSVNDTSTAADLNVSLNEDSSRIITAIPPNATDVDGDTLTITITTPALHGTTSVAADQTITYTPAANYAGPDSFEYQISDGKGGTDTGTVTVTVLPVNDPPAISDLAYLHETAEDTPANIAFTVSDIDTPLADLTFTFASDNTTLLPLAGISVSGTETARTLRLNPAANKNGVVLVRVTVSDGALSAFQDLQLTVTSNNDLPVANPDSVTTDEDTAITFNVVSNDSDIEDLVLGVASVTVPGHGSVVNNRNGTVTYTPASNWNGNDSFSYTVVDSNDGQSSATVSVRVDPVNDAPVAVTDAVTINEDTPVTIDLLDNDTDVEDDVISLVSVEAAAKGAWVDNEDGTITYTPDLDATGLDEFNYTITDGLLTDTGTIRVTITALNDAPRISSPVAEPWTFNEDVVGTFAIHVYDPETPADNLVMKITSSDQALLPDTSIQLQGSGMDKQLVLTPKPNKYGTLEICIEVTDGALTTTGCYDVLLQSVNDPPTISAIADQTVSEDVQTNVLNFTVTDVETAAGSLTVTAATSDGTLLPVVNVTLVNLGGTSRTVRVRPGIQRNGSGTVTLTVTDADGGSASEPFGVTVNPVNDAPSAVADSASTNEDSPITIDVLVNDTDPDLSNEGDNLTIVSTSGVSNGSVSIAPDNETLTFTPAANYNGSTSFTYTMRDSAGSQSSATVTVTVTAVNDAPTAVNDAVSTNEDTAKIINVLTNDTDSDIGREGDNLTIVSTANVNNGSVSIAGDNKSLTFTPTGNWNGEEVFDYTMRDSAGVQSSATVTVTVVPVNDAPTISNIANQTINEDGNSGAITFTVNDIDNDPATLTITATSNKTSVIPNANIVIVATGGGGREVTITPLANKNTWNKTTSTDNPATLTLTVKDSGNLTAADTLVVTVTPVNDPPFREDDSTSTNEDTAKLIDVLSIDDIDLSNEGDASLVITGASDPDHGSVAIAGDGKTLTYTPDLHWNGVETFTYTANDVSNLPATSTVTVTVIPVNDAPAATADTSSVNEDGSVLIDVLVNDTDVDLSREGDNLTITGTTSVDYGTVVLAGDHKSLTFTPSPNWNGTEVFSYTIKDNGNLTSTASVTVTVNPLDDNPGAGNDSFTMAEDGSTSLDVLANDTDADLNMPSDDLTVLSFSGIDMGIAEVTPGSKSITYTPPANWNGIEDFSYTMQDIDGATSTATVRVTVQPVNDAPQAFDNSASTAEDTAVVVMVLNNDTDIDLDAGLNASVTEVLSVSSVTTPSHGTSAVSGGSLNVTYTPAANWNGTDSFSYTLRDSSGATSVATVTVDVSAVNDRPNAANDTATTDEETPVTIHVLDNDSDVDLDVDLNASVTDSLSVGAIIGQPAHGSVEISTGSLTVDYTPDTDYNGDDTFTYAVTDLDGLTRTADVTVHVNQINDPLLAVDDTAETEEEEPVIIPVLDNDEDVDLDPVMNQDRVDQLIVQPLSYTDPLFGTLVLNGDNTFTYTPGLNFTGTDTFTYIAEDSIEEVTSSQATVTITITEPVNDAPIAYDDTASVAEDDSVEIDVLANDTDVDLLNEGDDLTIAATTGVENGTATIAADDKTLTFTPAADFFGSETFTYTVQDGGGLQDTANVTVTVSPVNDPPVISASLDYTMDEDTVSEAIAFTVTDIDNDDASLVVTTALDGETVIPLSGVSIALTGGSGRTITFTPLTHKNTSGSDPVEVTLTVSDGALTDEDSFAVTVNPLNDSPAAANDTALVDEDGSVEIDVLANDSDIDRSNEGDQIAIASVSGVDNAAVEILDSGQKLRFTPDTNWNGAEIFAYIIEDEDGLQSTANVSVTVNPVNDAPALSVIADQSIAEGSSSSAIAFTVTDIDNDPASLAVTAASNSPAIVAVSGILIAHNGGADRAATITPSGNKNTSGRSPVTVTLTVSDGALTGTRSFAVTVTPVNDAPVAVSDTAQVNEDESVEISVLVNDSDVDTAIEGDTFSVVSTSGVDNAVVTIIDGGRKLRFTPNANWNGEETFKYTIRDSGGLEATANVTVTAIDMPEAAVILPGFAMLTPRGGEAFKDGQTIQVTWKSLAVGATYKLEFFNGSSWSTLATNLNATNFDHALVNTDLHTANAAYRVWGTYLGESKLANGERFIIDNRPPAGVAISLSTNDGIPYMDGTWTNLPVVVTASGGTDLTGIQIQFEVDGVSAGSPAGQRLLISENGNHRVKVTAVDPLGNAALLADVLVMIDQLPPEEPLINQTSDSGSLAQIHFDPDPGSSGNETLILPDGSEVPATGEITWVPEEDGEYTFILIDNAGNRRVLKLFLKGLKKPVMGDRPADEAQIDGAQNGGAQNSGSRLPGLLGAVWAAGLLMFLLLIFLFWPNVRIEYSQRQADGSLRKHVRRRRVFTPDDKELVLTVPQAEVYEIRLSNGLTRSMRGGSVAVKQDQNTLPGADVPKDAKGRFSTYF